VRCDEDLIAHGLPGQRKTRVIVSKLCRAIDDVRWTPRAVACITYTNAAVYESKPGFAITSSPATSSTSTSVRSTPSASTTSSGPSAFRERLQESFKVLTRTARVPGARRRRLRG